MGCSQSHTDENVNINDIIPDGITRFKVFNDSTLTESVSPGISNKKGILEVNDDEVLHYQRHREPIRWSFSCLRRYGRGQNTFVFESGRRCTTGPGIFAFRCREADVLLSVFAEKLSRYSDNLRNNQNRMAAVNGGAGGGGGGVIRSRYSQNVGRTNPPTNGNLEEPYLVPISNQNGGLGGMQYVNGDVACGHSYMNTNGHPLTNPPIDVGELAVDLDSSHTTPVRGHGLNYADLDLPGANDKKSLRQLPGNINCIDINGSSDDDDDAFLPAPTTNGISYVNINGAHATSNGMRTIMYSETSVKAEKRPSESARAKAPGAESSEIQYTTIDFHKTAAVATTAKATQESSPHDECLRKTRHDSSAENLN